MGRILHFCVLEPMLSKADYSIKFSRTHNLTTLANKMHQHQRRERNMNEQLSVKTMVCGEYQRLLEECQSALEIWNEHRAEICRPRLIGKKAGDEILRFQANYARAYTALRNHVSNCLGCELVSRIRACDPESVSDALPDGTLDD